MEFGFVEERPERDIQRRKRARVVTSCDECRERKIKCVPPKPDARDGRCDACIDANIRCEYKDKDRYWAEKRPSSATGQSRSGAISFTSSTPLQQANAPGSQPPSGRSQYTPSGLAVAAYPDVESPTTASSGSSGGSAGWPLTSPSSSLSGGSARWSQSSPASSTWPSVDPYANASAVPLGMVTGYVGGSPPSTTSILHPLFDDQTAGYPHTALMPAYLYAFFQTFGRAYTFLNYEEVLHKHATAVLSPLLANVMAAMAVPYVVGAHQLVGHDLQETSKVYMSAAKKMLSYYLQTEVSSSTLHTVILIAWSELARVPQSVAEFKYYSELALQIATRFGLNQEATIQSLAAGNALQVARLRATWSCISQLFPAGLLAAPN